jgi:hypothetical protein
MIRHSSITISAVAIIAGAFALNAQAAPKPAPAPAPAPTQQQVAAAIDTIRMETESARKQTVAANMTFTDMEATAFWPVYDAYRAAMNKARDGEWMVIQTYAMNQSKLSDSLAQRLVGQWMDSRKAQQDVRTQFLPQFAKAIGWMKTARFYQVDNKMDLIVDVSRSSSIPLVSK